MPRNSSLMSTELAKKYNWKELEVSDELCEIGKSLDEAVKLTGAIELYQNTVDIRTKLYHALSLQKKGPSEEGLGALDKGEERVSNRAAIASSAADTQGITGVHKDKMIAEAVQKERLILEDKAKKQQLEMEQKLQESTRQLELAEKSKKDSEDKCTLANAAAEHQDAQLQSEQAATRSRVKAAEDAKTALQDTLKRMKRKHQDGEQLEDDDFGDVQVVKRKKTDELREERLQKAIDKAGDEDKGREEFEIAEGKREEKREAAAEKRQKKKEEGFKEQFLPELNRELKTEREKVVALESTLTELQEELTHQSHSSSGKKKESKKELKALKTVLEETKDLLDTKENDFKVAKMVIRELIKVHGVDKDLVRSINNAINEKLQVQADAGLVAPQEEGGKGQEEQQVETEEEEEEEE